MRWLLLLLLLPRCAGVVFCLTDAQPKLSARRRSRMADLERGKAIVDSLGLRRMREGEVRQLVLTESDLDKGVNYLGASSWRAAVPARRSSLSSCLCGPAVPLPGCGDI
jgi:hypothetical protein